MKLKKLPSKKALIKIEREEKRASGVYVADASNVKESAIVLQVAKDVTEFQVGDRILFKSWAVNNYKIGDEEFAILDEQHYDGTL